MEQNMYVHRLTMQDIVRAASAAYTSGKGPLPEGYKLVKVYDDEVSGFKAVVLEPIDLKKDGKHRIYMVAGTEYSTDGRFDPKDLMAVFSAGVDHLDNDVADRLIADAVKWVLRGGDISAGGHSLGDPVSKVIAYKIELDVRRAILKGEAGPEPRGRVSAEAGLSGFGDKKLRDEMRYDSLDALTAAIAKDAEDARAFFGIASPGASGGRRDFATSATDRIS